MYFRNYQLRKTWKHECLKNCVSEYTLTDNMANGWKQFCKMNDSTLTILINHSGGNYVRKILF